MQNVTLSNASEDKYKRWNKIFNPGLLLIGLSGTGTRTRTLKQLAERVWFTIINELNPNPHNS